MANIRTLCVSMQSPPPEGPWKEEDYERRLLLLLLQWLITKTILTVWLFSGEFLLQLGLLQLPYQDFNWLPLWLVTVWFCSRHGRKLCGNQLWEMHITVMTMVWQLSAAKECMDGMLLMIKEIFPPISCYFTDSLLPLSILCDLSEETWLSSPKLGCCKSTLYNMYKLPHTDEKTSLKYIPLSETGLPTCVLFWKWYKRWCVRLRSEACRSLRPQAVLENC